MSESGGQSIVSTPAIIGGLIGGFVHTGVVVILWNLFGLDNLRELVLIKPLYGMYILLGMFVLGFVPAVFYLGQKIISPAFVVALFLLLSGLGSWLAGPVRAPVGGPTPFGLYILFWVAIVALAGLISRFEHRRKQRAIG